MNLQQYIAAVKEKLAGSPIISVIEISDERIILNRGYFRARLTLINSDFLEIAESFTIQDNQTLTLDYRYQWMDSSKQLLRKRWVVLSIFRIYPIFPIMSILVQKLTWKQDNLEIF